MAQFGAPDSPPDYPSWATEPIRSRISRHPTPGTPRADGRLVLPSDPLGRHMATRHACRIHYDHQPWEPPCLHSSTELPTVIRLTVSGAQWIGPGTAPVVEESHVNGSWLLSGFQLAESACARVFSFLSPVPDDVFSSYAVVLYDDGVPFGASKAFEVGITVVSGWTDPPARVMDRAVFRTASVLTDADGKIDGHAQFPLTLLPGPVAGTQVNWDYATAVVTVEIETPAPPPPEIALNYARSESISIELQAKSAFEAHGWSGTTARGYNVYWRIKWRTSLPVAATPGVEHEIVFFRGGIEVGRRYSEWPDGTLSWSLESGLDLLAAIGEIRTPADDEPLDSGEFFGFESEPISDRWEWWNSHQLAPNFYEASPNGSVAVEARVQGFRFQDPQTTEGSGGWQRRWFEDLVNRRHILAPVLDPVGRWQINTLVKHGEVIYDPDAGTPVAQDGLYYTYAIVLVFNADGLALSLHIRLFNDLLGVPPFWEPIPSVSGTVFGIGPNHGGKILGAVPTDDLRLEGAALYPISTRSMDQYDLRDIVLTDKTPGPHPWLFDFEDCRITLGELKNRGDEPPAQGPLEFDMGGRFSGGWTRPLNTGQQLLSSPVNIAFGDVQYDYGGWFTGADTEVVVPDVGLRWVRAGSQMWTSNNVNAASMFIKVNGVASSGNAGQQENNGGSIGNFRQSAWTPWLALKAGDVITVEGTKDGATIDNTTWTWLAAEGRYPAVYPLASLVSEYGEPLPAVGEIGFVGEIPPSADGFELTSISASLLSAKSVSDAIICQVSVIRKATRSVEDFLFNALTIDGDHWSSDESSSPAVINPATSTVFAGDLVVLGMIDPGVGATGMSLSLEFTEP